MLDWKEVALLSSWIVYSLVLMKTWAIWSHILWLDPLSRLQLPNILINYYRVKLSQSLCNFIAQLCQFSYWIFKWLCNYITRSLLSLYLTRFTSGCLSSSGLSFSNLPLKFLLLLFLHIFTLRPLVDPLNSWRCNMHCFLLLLVEPPFLTFYCFIDSKLLSKQEELPLLLLEFSLFNLASLFLHSLLETFLVFLPLERFVTLPLLMY
jgi:hypothetical protein